MDALHMADVNENTVVDDWCEIKLLFNHATDDDRGDSTEKRAVFCKALADFLAANNIRFQELDVSDFYEEEPSPLLIVFGNDEIEQSDEKKLISRRNKGFFTIPMAIFSEDYFRLPEGELFGYKKTLESINSACSLPAVAFSEKDVLECRDSVKDFFLNVKQLYSTAELKGDASAACGEIYDIVKEFYAAGMDGSDDYIFSSMLLDAVKELSERYNEIEDIASECGVKLDGCADVFRDAQQRAEQTVTIDRFGYLGIPKIKTDGFTNKYNLLIEKINAFMDVLENTEQLCDNAAVKRGIRITREELAKGCGMSVVGTFSSGKTMLINMLLNHPHKLRISSSHNTAVLTRLFSCGSGSEHAQIIYKENVRVPLIEPMFGSASAQLYTGDEPVRVTDILYDMSGRTVVAKGTLTDTVYCITIDNDKRIIVRRDSVVAPGSPLTDGASGMDDCGFSRICAMDEFSAVLDEIQNDTLRNVRLELIDSNNDFKVLLNDDAVLTLLEISEAASAEAQVVPVESGRLPYRKVVLTGTLDKPPEEIILDSEGWKRFCDSEDGDVIAESAANRLFADKIDIYMDSAILNCASIVDTPGAGSVIRRHDSVTERCIQDKNGLLIVVVKVNQNTERRSLAGLLQTISSIYETDGMDKSGVVFVLNCHTSSTSQAKLVRSCSSMTRKICNYGFDRDKIFAFDLKKIIETNEYPSLMFGRFPSYEGFERCISAAIDANGIQERISDIRIFWDKLFAKESSAEEKKLGDVFEAAEAFGAMPELDECVSEKTERNPLIDEINRRIDDIADLRLDDIEPLIHDVSSLFDDVKQRIRQLDERRASWESGRVRIMTAVKDAAAKLQQYDTITERFSAKAAQILAAAGFDEIPPGIDIPQRQELKFPYESFRRLFEQKLMRFPMLFKRSYTDDSIHEFIDYINTEAAAAVREMKEYYHRCNLSTEDLKVACVEQLNEVLAELIKATEERVPPEADAADVIISSDGIEEESIVLSDDDVRSEEMLMLWSSLSEQWKTIFNNTDNEVYDCE